MASSTISDREVTEQKHDEIGRGRYRTGFVSDERMKNYSCVWDPDCPEVPERIGLTLEKCHRYGLLKRCYKIASRFATDEEIELNHSKELIKLIESTKERTDFENLEELSSKYFSVFFHPKAYECARLATGCALELVSAVLEGKVQNGLALIRPPGHHAFHNEPCGYCFYNNIAVTAKYALKNYSLDRILIVDWDVHHGQATQYSFYDDKRVLYFSIHLYKHGDQWPFLRESNYDYIGEKSGKGYNINIPLNEFDQGNTEYLSFFFNVLLPVAYEFCPQLVLISAGFDSALADPKGRMRVYPQFYPHLLHSLMGLANGKVCVFLEGGYCLPSLSESATLCLRTLLGDPCPLIGPLDAPSDSSATSVLNSLSCLRTYWKNLQIQETYSKDDNFSETDKIRHRPEIIYKGEELCKPKKRYLTKKFYNELESDVKLSVENEVHELIRKTDLQVPVYSTVATMEIINSRSESKDSVCQKIMFEYKDISKMITLLSETCNPLAEAINEVLLKNSCNGIISLNHIANKSALETAVNYCIMEHHVQRILVIDTSEFKEGKFKINNRILTVKLQGSSKISEKSKQFINFPWDKEKIIPCDYLIAFLNIVMPIAYQYDPEVVLMNTNILSNGTQDDQKALLPVFTHIVHLLSSLAYGKIVLINENQIPEETYNSLLNVLLKDSCLPIANSITPSNMSTETIRQVMHTQNQFWSCLKYDVFLPASEG